MRQLVADIGDALHNPAYLVLMCALLFSSIAGGFYEALNLYVYTYFWDLTTSQVALAVVGALVGSVGAFVLTSPLSPRFDKKQVALGALSTVLVVGPLPVFLRLMDVRLSNGHPLLPLILAAHVSVLVFAAVVIAIVTTSMVADTVDQSKLRTGKRQEGVFMSGVQFSFKATFGLGGFFAGLALDVISFSTGVDSVAIPSDKVFSLGLVVVPGVIAFYLIAFLIMNLYPLSRFQHRDNLARIGAG